METPPATIRLEQREKRYMFGIRNYGEIPQYLNAADNDAWDVVVPGYRPLPVERSYELRRVLGLVHMKNGNHKIIVDVVTDAPRENSAKVIAELQRYMVNYERDVHVPTRLVLFDPALRSALHRARF